MDRAQEGLDLTVANLVYNSTISVLDLDSGQTLPLLTPVSPTLVGKEVMNEENVGFVQPSTASPATAESSIGAPSGSSTASIKTDSGPDFTKIFGQVLDTGAQVGLKVYQGENAKQLAKLGKTGAPSKLGSVGGSGSGLLIAGAVVGGGLLLAAVVGGRKSPVQQPAAATKAAVATVKNNLSKPGGLLAALAAYYVAYKVYEHYRPKGGMADVPVEACGSFITADLGDDYDDVGGMGDGYAMNLVGGNEDWA